MNRSEFVGSALGAALALSTANTLAQEASPVSDSKGDAPPTIFITEVLEWCIDGDYLDQIQEVLEFLPGGSMYYDRVRLPPFLIDGLSYATFDVPLGVVVDLIDQFDGLTRITADQDDRVADALEAIFMRVP